MSLEGDFKKLSKQVDRLVKQSEGKIGKQYAKLLRGLQHEIADWFSAYADSDGKLNYSDLQKYDRISKLEKQLSEKIRAGTVPISKEIRDTTRAGLTTSFTATKDIVGKEAGRKIRGVLDRKKIQNIMQNKLTGLTLNERLSTRRADIERRIRETVSQGLVNGETYKTMADRLKDELEKDTAKAMRIVRTESHRTMETGKHEAMVHAQNQGVIQKKWWMTSFDERLREEHLELGQKYSQANMIDLEDDFVCDMTGSSGPHPGAMTGGDSARSNINCRCNKQIKIVAVGKDKKE